METLTRPTSTTNPLRLMMEFSFDADASFANVAQAGLREPNASLKDCSDLVTSVTGCLAIAEMASRNLRGKEPHPGMLYELSFPLRVAGSFYTVKQLHYGSPFSFDVILNDNLTAIGLGFIFYGAKRLFGADFEFRAYREKRRVDYLEARRTREILEKEPPEIDSTGVRDPRHRDPYSAVDPPSHWQVEEAVITDDPD